MWKSQWRRRRTAVLLPNDGGAHVVFLNVGQLFALELETKKPEALETMRISQHRSGEFHHATGSWRGRVSLDIG